MMNLKPFLMPALAMMALISSAETPNTGYSDGEITRSLVYNKGDYSSQFYRIPAIVTLPDGTLVTVADKRIDKLQDLPGDIDVVCRRSTDGGRTWGPYITVAEHDSLGGYGDPALVYDRRNGNILVISTHGQGLWMKTPGQISVSRSTDGGLTWLPPVNINPQILTSDPEGPQPIKCNSAFASSGRAVQLASGRILFVLVTRRDGMDPFPCYAIYSDDSGRTWHVSETPTTTDGDESKILQLPDGTLLTSIRNRYKLPRTFARSTDGGRTWSEPYSVPTLPDPACNGDFITYTCADGSVALLQSLPTGGTRDDVTIFVSRDLGKTWVPAYQVVHGPSTYSSMTVLPDGRIGILTEEATHLADPHHLDGYRIWFTSIPASRLGL